MRRSRFVVVLFALAVAASCGDSRVLGPEARDGSELPADTPAPPSFAISDAVHEGGNPHFFWLSPMVADPEAFNGDFDASQSPAVRICDLADCAANEVAAYTMSSGLGSETVRLGSPDEHYIVNWHTDESSAMPGPTYRITVTVAGTEIGFADVVLGTSGKDAKNLTTNETIGLKDGRTLPVKFRIEQGAVFAIDAAEGGTIDALDGTATIEVPAGAVAGETGFTVEAVPPVDEQLEIIELGPAGLTFPDDKPVVVTLTYDESALAGIPEEDLALNTFEDGEWIVVPGFQLDLQNNTASAPFYHFSKASIGPAENAVVCSSDGNPHTFADIQGALDSVIDGGTVSICGETQVADSVSVQKAVTIEGRGGARPMIQTTTARGGFMVEGVASGTVTFDGLDFENLSPRDTNVSPQKNTYSIRARDAFDHLVIRNSSFVAVTGTTGNVVVEGQTASPGSHVEIIDSQFTGGGRLGLNVIWHPDVDVTGSTFGGHEIAAIWYQRSSGRIESSTFGPNCGLSQCLVVLGSEATVDVVGNAFTETNTTYSNGYEVIWLRTSGTGRIDNNTFDGCGPGACIRATGGALAEITNNEFTIDSSHGTEFAIVGTDGSGGTRVPLYPPPTVIATDNTITGVGTDQAGYATVHSAISAEWGTMLTAHRNTITNTGNGITAYGAPAVVTDATNNVITNVRHGIGAYGGTQVSARFNDITNVSGLQIDIPDSDPTLSDLTCNWWGINTGPTAVGPVPASTYTPFATAAIANTGTTSCTGGATQVLFWSSRDGAPEIYLTDVVGSPPVNLSNSPSTQDAHGAWSPDGTLIAFTRIGSTGTSVVVMNSDGTGQSHIAQFSSFGGQVGWSPSGSKLAFGGAGTLNVMNPDGTANVALPLPPAGVEPTGFDWAPDGTRLVATHRAAHTSGTKLYVLNADGSGVANVLAHDAGRSDLDPRWSPDGSTIGFRCLDVGGTYQDVCFVNPDGTSFRRLGDSLAQGPAWSPDGTKIAFRCWGAVDSDICLMNADTSGRVNLTNTPGHDFSPQWSRDGAWISFESVRDGNSEVYVIQADGLGQANVSAHAGHDAGGRIRP